MNLEGAVDPLVAASRIKEHASWYHTIEVAPGVVTPGVHDSKSGLGILDEMGLPTDCSGLRVLDIGCRDGFFAFELERRGAVVLGIDYVEPTRTGFSIVAGLLGSKARFVVENVYDLNAETHGVFDIVLFLGVLYHLRNPMLALDKIRSVTKNGGLLFVETQMAVDPDLAACATPAMQFFPRHDLNGDPTTKWGPNLSGLRAIVEESQFHALSDSLHGGRGYLKAVAVEDDALARASALDSANCPLEPGMDTFRAWILGSGT